MRGSFKGSLLVEFLCAYEDPVSTNPVQYVHVTPLLVRRSVSLYVAFSSQIPAPLRISQPNYYIMIYALMREIPSAVVEARIVQPDESSLPRCCSAGRSIGGEVIHPISGSDSLCNVATAVMDLKKKSTRVTIKAG